MECLRCTDAQPPIYLTTIYLLPTTATDPRMYNRKSGLYIIAEDAKDSLLALTSLSTQQATLTPSPTIRLLTLLSEAGNPIFSLSLSLPSLP
jgi:hypothetical protein